MPAILRKRIILVLLSLTFLPAPIAISQGVNSDLLHQRWKARWISHPDGPSREFGVFHFRKTFSLDAVPQRFVIHASGDNRYELFVNGTRAVAGPARGHLNHWRYETLDIASQLRPGKNVLAAVVWNFAELAPMAQMTNEAGLILQGDGRTEEAVNTDASWKAFKSNAVEMIPMDVGKIGGYLVVGPGEQVDGAKCPWGWEGPDFDDSTWQLAKVITEAGPRGIQDSPSRWMLVPRSIPLMEEKIERPLPHRPRQQR